MPLSSSNSLDKYGEKTVNTTQKHGYSGSGRF